MPKPFAHLHVHTQFSLLDGMIRESEAWSYIAAMGQTAMAVTDHGTLAGMWKFHRAAEKFNASLAEGQEPVKLIAGLETYIVAGPDGEGRASARGEDFIEIPAEDASDPDDKETAKGAKSDGETRTKRKYHEHLTLIAATPEGWRNLVRIQNRADTPENRYGRGARTDFATLARHSEGLICLTGCLGGPVLGPVSRAVAAHAAGDAETASREYGRASAMLDRLIGIFGRERTFVEIMEHGIPEETAAVPTLVGLAQQKGLACVATNDAHYLSPERAEAHEAWLCQQTQDTLDNPNRYHFHGSGYHLASEDEMRAKRPEPWWQDAVSMAGEVAALCADSVMPERKTRLPAYPVPEGYGSPRDYLIHLAKEGAQKHRGSPVPPEVRDRMNFEFGIVEEMGVIDYFLVVHDMLAWAESQGIARGYARGSAAGSELGYHVDIHRVDPMRHDLLFERFLEPGRVGLPDVDSDFPTSRQHDVFEYLENRWGADRSARIGTFTFSRTRRALKDAARLLRLDRIGERLSKAVPVEGGKPLTIADLADTSKQQGNDFRRLLAEFDQPDEEGVAGRGSRVLALAAQFEGLVAGAGIHPCGFVISSEPIDDMVPLRTVHEKTGAKDDDGNDEVRRVTIAAWDGEDVEDLGLVKLDVLGITNIDIAENALAFARERDPSLDLTMEGVPDPDTVGDPKVDKAWELIRSGRTSGLFQLEGAGITETTKDVAPTCWADLSAILALYRPGPMAAGYHTDYGARKNGQSAVSYDAITTVPAEQRVIEEILGKTYGLMIYQEQVMAIAGAVSGFDAKMRSKLRKAVGKKKKDDMRALREPFMRGGMDPEAGAGVGFREDTLDRIWGLIEANAEYLFNKCVAGGTLASTAAGEVRVDALYARLHGGLDVPDGVCDHCGERPASPRGLPCRACRSWIAKFRDPKRGNWLVALDESDGRLRPQRVVDIHANGVKPLWKVTLEDGRSIRATGNHRLLGEGGWVRIDEMSAGDLLAVDLGPDHDPGPWPKHEPGALAKLADWGERTREGASCAGGCGATEGLRRVRLDGRREHIDEANLAWMCISCDLRRRYRNGRTRTWGRGRAVGWSPIASIERDGEEETFDVEMAEGSSHSWVADGIVSHNSHSVGYSMLTFATAYVKANWPAEFAAALIAEADSADRRPRVIQAIRQEGIEILPPDVNLSEMDARPVGDAQVRLGFNDIKGLPAAEAQMLIAIRDGLGGSFSSFQELVTSRVSQAERPVSLSAIDRLIESGACDRFGPRLGLAMVSRAQVPAGVPVAIPDAEWGSLERANRQRELLRASFGRSVLATFEDQCRAHVTAGCLNPESEWAMTRRIEDIPSLPVGQVQVLATIGSYTPKTYKGGTMAAVILSGERDSIEGVMWNDEVERQRESWEPEPGAIVIARGSLKMRSRIVEDAETGEETEIVSQQLTISHIEKIPVLDDDIPAAMPDPAEIPEFPEPGWTESGFKARTSEMQDVGAALFPDGLPAADVKKARAKLGVLIAKSSSTGKPSIAKLTPKAGRDLGLVRPDSDGDGPEEPEAQPELPEAPQAADPQPEAPHAPEAESPAPQVPDIPPAPQAAQPAPAQAPLARVTPIRQPVRRTTLSSLAEALDVEVDSDPEPDPDPEPSPEPPAANAPPEPKPAPAVMPAPPAAPRPAADGIIEVGPFSILPRDSYVHEDVLKLIAQLGIEPKMERLLATVRAGSTSRPPGGEFHLVVGGKVKINYRVISAGSPDPSASRWTPRDDGAQ